MLEEKLTQLLQEHFKEEEFQDCYVVEVVRGKGDKVEAFIDSDGELTLRKCQRISRFLEKHIEENKWLEDKYTLEVSSPGLGRPLQLLRQYKKNVGRNIRVKADDGVDITGLLETVTDKGIVVVEKLKKKETKNHEFAYSEIREAKIQISFKK